MKVFTLTTLISLSVIASSAIFSYPKPEMCPSVAALQSVKFEVASLYSKNNTWAVGVLRNNYETKDTWTFFIDGFKAKDNDDAIAKGNAALTSLSFLGGPFHVEQPDFDMWYCDYNTILGEQTMAYTPAYQGDFALKLGKQR